MAINDFQKKRYKMIPGANYEDGPISRDGTFFNMMSRKMGERNKQIADSVPNHDEPVSGEFIEGVTDSINPVGGAIRFVKGLSSVKPSMSVVKEFTRNPRFKQGVEDHISDKNRNVFGDSEQRSYFEKVSPHTRPYNDGTELFRGQRVNADDELLLLNEGDYFMSDRAMPFSHQRDVADAFSQPTSFETNSVLMNIPKPRSGIDMWDLRKNNAWNESEVTIPANIKYRVQGLVDKTVNDVPRRELILEEVDTIPEGGRLLTYRSDGARDYTNPEEIATKREMYEESLQRARERGRPALIKMNEDRLNRLNSEFAESERNRGNGLNTRGIRPISNPPIDKNKDITHQIMDMI